MVNPILYSKFNSPEKIFLIFSLIFGILFCVFIPYGAGFDEEQHMVRIYDISGLHLLPNRSSSEGTLSFNDFISLSYQRRYYQTPANDLFLPEKFLKPVDREQMVAFPTRSIYPPLNFLPEAAIAGIAWRVFNAPVIPVAILCRLAGLLLYIMGCYFAIRLLPFGKWILTILCLSPMALFQASTLNADGFMNAVSFLFIALTINIYAQRDLKIANWKIWFLATLIVTLGLCKPGAILILALLVIFPFRMVNSRWLNGLVISSVLMAIVFTVGFNAVSVNGSHFSDDGGQSLSKQLTLVAANPLDFVRTFVLGNILAAGRYFRNWTGVYGYWNGIVPEIIYWLYPLLLLAGLLMEPAAPRLSKPARLGIFGAFIIAATGTAFLYSYLHYSPGDLETFGKQGRYFIPNAPLLYLSLCGLLPAFLAARKWMKYFTLGLLSIILVFYSLGLYATYYTFCGQTLYTFGQCSQPVYKNLDIQTTPDVELSANGVLTQNFLRTCNQFRSVSIYVKSLPKDMVGTLKFTVLDNSDHLIASQDFPVNQIKPGSYLSIAAQSTDYELYKIKLETIGFSAGQNIHLSTNEDSSYGNGDLIIKGEKMETDLIFQFECSSW